MTLVDIDSIFPPGAAGNAQISDLRILLTRLVVTDSLGGINFDEVQDIPTRNALAAKEGDICKVSNVGNGTSGTYIFNSSDIWVTLVDTISGGSSPTLNRTTEKFTVSATVAANGSVDLLNIPNTLDHLFIFLNGMYLTMGAGYDYTLAGTSLIFNNNILTAGDTLTVKYSF